MACTGSSGGSGGTGGFNSLRQGDTTTVMMELSEPLAGKSLKVGIYSSAGKPLFETYYPGDLITLIDSTHLSLTIPYETTRYFYGITTMRFAVFDDSKSLVNAGENAITINWVKEPVTQSLP